MLCSHCLEIPDNLIFEFVVLSEVPVNSGAVPGLRSSAHMGPHLLLPLCFQGWPGTGFQFPCPWTPRPFLLTLYTHPHTLATSLVHSAEMLQEEPLLHHNPGPKCL